MKLQQRIALAGLGIGLSAMSASSATAQQTQAPAQNSGRYTYQNSTPDSGPSAPSLTFQFGKWGSQPSDYPYAQTWAQHAKPDDNACNMPSSPCWNEDRE